MGFSLSDSIFLIIAIVGMLISYYTEDTNALIAFGITAIIFNQSYHSEKIIKKLGE